MSDHYGVSSTGSKVRMNNTNHFYSSRQTKWSLYRVSSTGSKTIITPIIFTLQNKQNEWSLYRVSSNGSKTTIITPNSLEYFEIFWMRFEGGDRFLNMLFFK